MSAELPRTPGLAGGFRAGLALAWRELPAAIASCAILVGAAAPAALAVVADAPGWIVALAAAPALLLTTGMARVGAAIADGRRARVRSMLDVDPVLALVATAAAVLAAALLGTEGAGWFAGLAVAAVALVVLPLALAYGAVRGRRGLGAVRGGAILAAYRPGAALTALALGVLGGFAVAATLGALALVVPAALAAVTARIVAGILSDVDAAQGVRG